ncbi:MAG: hypothetical protein KIT84_20835 [Labilithrix sp.]|nr:hypothetical protein [Labilithrix sp.]MCW5813488.1 hypothetical protein [Labilithrix sp.]
MVRAETVNRIAPPSRATSRTVRCGCSDDGLHITAPPGSKVTVPEDATYDAEAQIVLPDEAPGQPIRRTKSLGFIGDAPLTQTPSRGGPWNAPDALLPPHAHHEPYYGLPRGGYGYRAPRYGYAPSYTPHPTTPYQGQSSPTPSAAQPPPSSYASPSPAAAIPARAPIIYR